MMIASNESVKDKRGEESTSKKEKEEEEEKGEK